MQLPKYIVEMLARIQSVAPGKVKIGVVGTIRKVFDYELGLKQFAALKLALATHSNIELVNVDEVTEHGDGVIWAGQISVTNKVASKLLFEGVDGLIIMPVNYGDEESAAELARRVVDAIGCPVATFVHHEAPIHKDGKRDLDDGCGILPMRKEMAKRMGRVPFYIRKSPIDTEKFRKSLFGFLQVCAGVRALHSVRGVQIGADQPTFYGIQTSKDGTQAMFNMRFETFDSADFQKMLVEGLANPPEWFGEVLDWIKSKIDYSEVEKDFPDTASLTALALGYVLEILVAKESNAVSINCWASIQENLRFMVCGVNALLFELGIMAPCETDWGGALANAVLQGVALGMENPVGCFMDLTRFDEETGKSLFWHCGEGAPCLVCGECKAKQGWIIPTTRGCAGLLNGKVGNVGDKVTFLQLRSGINGYPRFIAFNGAIVDGDDTIGTHFYVQVSDPEAFEDWMAQVLPLHHHSIMLGANLLPAIRKISEWTGIVLDEYDELTKRVTKCVL